MSEMSELRSRIALLEKQNKESSSGDPVENRNRALVEHLEQRAAALPNHDVKDLQERAAAIRETPDNSDLTNAFVYALQRFMGKNGPYAHDFAYILDLAEEAHQHALDSKTAVTESPDDESAKDSRPEDNED